jgi:hypothetical protein
VSTRATSDGKRPSERERRRCSTTSKRSISGNSRRRKRWRRSHRSGKARGDRISCDLRRIPPLWSALPARSGRTAPPSFRPCPLYSIVRHFTRLWVPADLC